LSGRINLCIPRKWDIVPYQFYFLFFSEQDRAHTAWLKPDRHFIIPWWMSGVIKTLQFPFAAGFQRFLLPCSQPCYKPGPPCLVDQVKAQGIHGIIENERIVVGIINGEGDRMNMAQFRFVIN